MTYSAELDLVNWANLDLNLFLLEQMDELAARIGEAEFEKVSRHIESRLPQISEAWKQSPLGFWRDAIKTPLVGQRRGGPVPFAPTGMLALPPGNIVPFMEGTVVSVTLSG